MGSNHPHPGRCMGTTCRRRLAVMCSGPFPRRSTTPVICHISVPSRRVPSEKNKTLDVDDHNGRRQRRGGCRVTGRPRNRQAGHTANEVAKLRPHVIKRQTTSSMPRANRSGRGCGRRRQAWIAFRLLRTDVIREVSVLVRLGGVDGGVWVL